MVCITSSETLAHFSEVQSENFVTIVTVRHKKDFAKQLLKLEKFSSGLEESFFRVRIDCNFYGIVWGGGISQNTGCNVG